MSGARYFVGAVVAAGLASALAAACSGPSDPNIGVATPPEDAANWHPVADYLDHRCGSLDCHGTPVRNLVIWGCSGFRVESGDATVAPGCRRQGGVDTTAAEYDATFRSVVGLEPQVMTAVVQGHGADPELLTLVRKPRGMESHKGGILITPGDYQDQCLTSWLAGQTNAAACAQAINIAEGVIPDAGAE